MLQNIIVLYLENKCSLSKKVLHFQFCEEVKMVLEWDLFAMPINERMGFVQVTYTDVIADVNT